MENPLPMIDSIIPPHRQAKWEKVDGSEGIALLHDKFWGDDNFGKQTLKVREDEGPEEDRDEGPEEDKDDPDDPDCFTLDHGIQILGHPKLWVRKEYIRMYKYCDEFLETNRNKGTPPSLIITGQPGIGKSFWLVYAVCRRLAEKKPTMWYREPDVYLFVTDGVYRYPMIPSSDSFRTRIWTFVDADSEKSIPSSLARQHTNYLNVFTSSPNQERWAPLTKTTNYKVAIMNPWTRGEISHAAPIHGFEPNDPRIDQMYSQYGPTPRICFNYLQPTSHLNDHETRLQEALSTLTSRILQKMVSGVRQFSVDFTSHTILLVKRRRGDEWNLATLEPITPAVEMALRDQLRSDTQAERLKLYYSLANVEGSRPLAGVVYKLLVQEKLRLQNTIVLNLVPMVKRRPDRSGPWHSTHGDGADPSSVQSFNITRTANDSFSSKPDSISNEVYYAPKAPNQVGFDSFIMANGRLFIFQFTTASAHDIKNGILTFFSQYPLPPIANWYFVFVVPPTSLELRCSQPRDPALVAFLEKINMCSVVMNPEP